MKKCMLIGGIVIAIGISLVGCTDQTEEKSQEEDGGISILMDEHKEIVIQEDEDIGKSTKLTRTTVIAEEEEPTSEVESMEMKKEQEGRRTDTATREPSIENVEQENTQNSTKSEKQEEKKEVTAPPVKEETQITASSEEQPQEVEKPPEKVEEIIPQESQVESFDVSSYASFAKSYANSIGLTTDVVANECWDNPISANLNKQNINADIQSRLNRYVNEGCEGVWIWTEKQSETQYLIYIGYY